MTDTERKKHWYILRVVSTRENTAKENISTRIQQSGVSDLFGEILVPTEKTKDLKTGEMRNLNKKIFPGYLFLEFSLNDKTLETMQGIPLVKGFLSIDRDTHQPLPMNDEEIKNVKLVAQQSDPSKRLTFAFKIGQLVKVLEGPFAGFNGIIENVDHEKLAARLSLYILGRTLSVDIEYTHIIHED